MRRWRSFRWPSARSGVNLTLTISTLTLTPTPTPTLFLTLALAPTPTLALALPLAQVKSRLDALRRERFRGHALAAVASPFKRIGSRLRRGSTEGGNQRTTGGKGSAPSWSSSAGYPPATRHSSPDLRRPSAGYPPSASPPTRASVALRRASTSDPRGAAAEGEEGGEAPHTPGPPPAEGGKERELMELALAYELMSRVAMQEG